MATPAMADLTMLEICISVDLVLLLSFQISVCQGLRFDLCPDREGGMVYE
jgi:hypothetical protein